MGKQKTRPRPHHNLTKWRMPHVLRMRGEAKSVELLVGMHVVLKLAVGEIP